MTPDKLSLLRLAEMKRGEKIVMVTAYDAPSARLADAQGSNSCSSATRRRWS
jgi:ketopantoate hydroxymethyltransferase